MGKYLTIPYSNNRLLVAIRKLPADFKLSIDFKIRSAKITFWNVNLQSLFWEKIGFISVHFWNDFFQFSNNVMK